MLFKACVPTFFGHVSGSLRLMLVFFYSSFSVCCTYLKQTVIVVVKLRLALCVVTVSLTLLVSTFKTEKP